MITGLYYRYLRLKKCLMKKLVLLLCLALSIKVSAQNTIQKSPMVFTHVEQMPTPSIDVNTYIAQHLRYPKVARRKGIEGRVVVRFVVDSLGKEIDFKIIKSVHPLLDSEAVLVIKELPDWEPGHQLGKPVNVTMFLPIEFHLEPR